MSGLTLEFNLRACSGRSFKDLVEKSGLPPVDMTNDALCYYMVLAMPEFAGGVFGAHDEKADVFTPFNLAHTSSHHSHVCRMVSTSKMSMNKIENLASSLKTTPLELMTSAFFLYDQILDALSEGHTVAMVDEENDRYTEILRPALKPPSAMLN